MAWLAANLRLVWLLLSLLLLRLSMWQPKSCV
jgi:hypothetical protein